MLGSAPRSPGCSCCSTSGSLSAHKPPLSALRCGFRRSVSMVLSSLRLAIGFALRRSLVPAGAYASVPVFTGRRWRCCATSRSRPAPRARFSADQPSKSSRQAISSRDAIASMPDRQTSRQRCALRLPRRPRRPAAGPARPRAARRDPAALAGHHHKIHAQCAKSGPSNRACLRGSHLLRHHQS